jgi:hypothetical protein
MAAVLDRTRIYAVDRGQRAHDHECDEDEDCHDLMVPVQELSAQMKL